MSFKTAIQEYGKEITASFICNGITYSDNRIISMTPHYDGRLFSSVMRCMDIQLDGVKELIAGDIAIAGVSVAGVAVAGVSEISGCAIAGVSVAGVAVVGVSEIIGGADTINSAKFGVKAPGEVDYNYKSFGTYIIKAQKYDDDANTLNLECYDLMLQSMIPYDLTLDYENGVTVKDLLDAVCDRFGWTKGYTTFTNSGIAIDEEKFDSSYTFRDVLDQIAQVAAGVIAFKGDALCVLYPTDTGEIIDASNLRTLTIGEKYGPVNSVVIARTPQEDNIYAYDEESVAENGLTEVKIENNQIMDSHREDFIDAILARVNGLEFWLYDMQSFGIGYLDLCDTFILETMDGKQHKTIMLSDELQISQSLAENASLEAPAATETDYKAASTTDKVLNKTILKVDKQAQEISSLVSKTETVENAVTGLREDVTKMSEILVDEDSINFKISEAIGGIDSVKTSTGYTFDKNGLNISKSDSEIHNRLDHTGMYVTRSNDEILVANNNGVTALNLTSRQFLIVGDNSRFENYDNGTDSRRTACFYIGG